ncbi:MAG: 50S ribosomal protein L5 [Spirochaetes bacterium]|nr:50S ribosomal protein L5 [Spirochaetota bacterium]
MGLKETYLKKIRPEMKEAMKYASIMAVPRLDKIVLNMGISKAVDDKKFVDTAADELSLIAGQRVQKTLAKKAISNFKIRQGMPLGCKVTLRGNRAYEFLERLIYVALPRVRDFQGIPRRSFDGKGNYNLGVKEHIIFPEISYEKTDMVKGLNITIGTTAKTNEEALELLSRLGLPFRKK